MASSLLSDEKLGINTEIPGRNESRASVYLDYEPTKYTILAELFKKYVFEENDQFIDFGCGEGRVLISAVKMGCKNAIGVEVNKNVFDICQDNVNQCNMQESISLHNCAAEKYEICDTTNKFFFYNPFHLKIFILVLNHITESISENYRENYLFFVGIREWYKVALEECERVQYVETLKLDGQEDIDIYTILRA